MISKPDRKRAYKLILILSCIAAAVIIADIFLPDAQAREITEIDTGAYRQELPQNLYFFQNNWSQPSQNNYCKEVDEGELVYFIDQKNSAYKVQNASIRANRETVRNFNAMMSDFYNRYRINNVTVSNGFVPVSDYGQSQSQSVLAAPLQDEIARHNYSHCCGPALDLIIVTNDGQSRTFNREGSYAWIDRYAYRYGFLSCGQYKENSQSAVPWHIVYIGKEHTLLMKEKNMNLQEYENYIKKFPFGKRHLKLQLADGSAYELYYAESGEKGTVLVPKDLPYRISELSGGGLLVSVRTDAPANV